ncbi:MAG: GNAT family N-acetyltransferase [Candidatus Zixiibacteriota bacterium]|nr:MAG: GNAT family N-acetyltransferase [candidate division Zixibacteria bacterium]
MKNNKKNEADFIEELGTLAFASRLRRLSERLLRDVSQTYRAENLNFEARWFSAFYLLWRQSPLAVTAIAQRLHLTHPAVNQVAGAMAKAGLLISTRDSRDDRRRLLSLSPAGRSLACQLEPIWRDIQEATAELVKASGIDLLGAIAQVEKSLDETNMCERVRARRKGRQMTAVEIVDYQPRYRKDFEKLNLEWIEKYFVVESSDMRVLGDPQGEIIDKGGAILFARLDRKIVGTVALIKHDSKTFELTKMAVTEKAQGQQVGKRLALAAIDYAQSLRVRRILLFTSPKLIAANALYRQLGFKPLTIPRAEIPFRRPSIAMELQLERISGQKKHRSQK